MKLSKLQQAVKILGFLFIILILVPLGIVWGMIGNIIDATFFRYRRMEFFFDDLKKNWIPKEKYLYLNYYVTGELEKFIKNEIFPKYGKYIVTDVSDGLNGSLKNTVFQKSAKIMYLEFAEDYDGDLGIILLTISKISDDNLHINRFIPVFGKKNYFNVPQTKKLLKEAIEECLKEWGVKI